MFRLLQSMTRLFSLISTKKVFTAPLPKLVHTLHLHDPCKFCKGYGLYKCYECMGITRIYEGEKEYRCDNCKGGIVECTFCRGSGISHSVF
jgi:hypothetical protein